MPAEVAEEGFAGRIVAWQRLFGRHDLPWQSSPDPYRIWLSEVMLQQTQVQTVISYYLKFLEQFPDLAALAAAPLERVMELWSGLGYYSRARNLHRCARLVVDRHGGRFPASTAALAGLPGIGESTAAAIAVFAFGESAAILDGNVKRVLCRHFGVPGWPGERPIGQMLWTIARRELPQRDIERYTQGLMDLGAGLCRRGQPRCDECPVGGSCVARAEGRQANLPTPRPARIVPLRQTAWLVMVCGGQVLLERRAPVGIWGGLLSLPEAQPAGLEKLAADAAARFGIEVLGIQALAPVRHAFTHFRLMAQPVLIEAGHRAAFAADAPQRWVALAGVASQALARPIRVLLERLARR